MASPAAGSGSQSGSTSCNEYLMRARKNSQRVARSVPIYRRHSWRYAANQWSLMFHLEFINSVADYDCNTETQRYNVMKSWARFVGRISANVKALWNAPLLLDCFWKLILNSKVVISYCDKLISLLTTCITREVLPLNLEVSSLTLLM